MTNVSRLVQLRSENRFPRPAVLVEAETTGSLTLWLTADGRFQGEPS